MEKSGGDPVFFNSIDKFDPFILFQLIAQGNANVSVFFQHTCKA
jgi:hypothetical protein